MGKFLGECEIGTSLTNFIDLLKIILPYIFNFNKNKYNTE